MTRRQILLNIIAFSIIPVSIYSVTPYNGSMLNIIPYLRNTTAWWLIISIILFAFFMNSYYYREKGNSQNMKVVQWYLLWNVFCIIRGTFIAETYWDWKGLVGNIFALLIPIIAYTVTNKVVLQSILSSYVKYALPLFFIIGLAITTDAYGFYLMPISFLMLFFPVLTNRWKYVVVAFSLLVMTIDLGARSNVIKFGLPALAMLIYYFRAIVPLKSFEIVRLILIIIPIFLFSMAASGVFNIFRMDEYIKGDYESVEKDAKGQVVESNLTGDTRTFLYVEVLQTAKLYNSWWIGRSPARGNKSESFGDDDENGRGERLENEVAVLNVFTWTGVIGLILYLFVFYRASYMAVNHSKNIFVKIIGLMVAFRWAYSWVEDINIFSLNYLMLWVMIGVCFSKSFRSMTNREMTYWVRGIFNINYARLSRKKTLNTKTEKATNTNSDYISRQHGVNRF